MRTINITKKANQSEKSALLNFILENGYPELSPETMEILKEHGQTSDHVLHILLKNEYGRYTHIQAYTYDIYGKLDLELFEIKFIEERAS